MRILFFGLYRVFWFFLFCIFQIFCSLLYFKKNQLNNRLKIKSILFPQIWIHVASIGEAKGALGFILTLRKNRCQEMILLTTTSLNGFRFLEEIFSQEKTSRVNFQYLQKVNFAIAPFDNFVSVRNFLNHQKIRQAFFYEMELWPEYLHQLKKKKIPIQWISARISPRHQWKFQIFLFCFPWVLNCFQKIETIDTYTKNYLSLKVKSMIFQGIDYKMVYYLKTFPRVKKKIFKRFTLGFISLHYAELLLLEDELESLKKKFDLIIIPRYQSEFKKFDHVLAKYQILGYRDIGKAPSRHFWVDHFPMEKSFLLECSHVFVGGSMIDKGGHNLIEPFVQKCFVFFGPFVDYQLVMKETLIKYKLGKQIHKFSELKGLEKYFLHQHQYRDLRKSLKI